MKLNELSENDDDNVYRFIVETPQMPYITIDDVWDWVTSNGFKAVTDIDLNHDDNKSIFEFKLVNAVTREGANNRARSMKRMAFNHFGGKDFLKFRFKNNQLMINKWLRYIEAVRHEIE